jgi:hypothetical protein
MQRLRPGFALGPLRTASRAVPSERRGEAASSGHGGHAPSALPAAHHLSTHHLAAMYPHSFRGPHPEARTRRPAPGAWATHPRSRRGALWRHAEH